MEDLSLKNSSYEKLKNKSHRLSIQSLVLRDVAENLYALHQVSPEHSRLYENNERKGYLGFDFNCVSSCGKVDLTKRYHVLSYFSEQGDPLCLKIMNFIKGVQNTKNINDFLGYSQIAEKFLTRTMTEQEYNGILNGKLPFTKDFDGEEYFL